MSRRHLSLFSAFRNTHPLPSSYNTRILQHTGSSTTYLCRWQTRWSSVNELQIVRVAQSPMWHQRQQFSAIPDAAARQRPQPLNLSFLTRCAKSHERRIYNELNNNVMLLMNVIDYLAAAMTLALGLAASFNILFCVLWCFFRLHQCWCWIELQLLTKMLFYVN